MLMHEIMCVVPIAGQKYCLAWRIPSKNGVMIKVVHHRFDDGKPIFYFEEDKLEAVLSTLGKKALYDLRVRPVERRRGNEMTGTFGVYRGSVRLHQTVYRSDNRFATLRIARKLDKLEPGVYHTDAWIPLCNECRQPHGKNPQCWRCAQYLVTRSYLENSW
jgi:hypothetical protein